MNFKNQSNQIEINQPLFLSTIHWLLKLINHSSLKIQLKNGKKWKKNGLIMNFFFVFLFVVKSKSLTCQCAIKRVGLQINWNKIRFMIYEKNMILFNSFQILLLKIYLCNWIELSIVLFLVIFIYLNEID